jgi:hypothetical protein
LRTNHPSAALWRFALRRRFHALTTPSCQHLPLGPQMRKPLRAPQPRLTQRDALTFYELWSSVDGTRTPRRRQWVCHLSRGHLCRSGFVARPRIVRGHAFITYIVERPSSMGAAARQTDGVSHNTRTIGVANSPRKLQGSVARSTTRGRWQHFRRVPPVDPSRRRHCRAP